MATKQRTRKAKPAPDTPPMFDRWDGMTRVSACGARPGPGSHATLAEALASTPEPTAEQYANADHVAKAPEAIRAILDREESTGEFTHYVVSVVGVRPDGTFRRVD